MESIMKRTCLSVAIALACCMSTGLAMAQATPEQDASPSTTTTKTVPRTSASSTSNTTTSNDTRRVQQLSTVLVQGKSLSLGGPDVGTERAEGGVDDQS